MSCCRIWSQEKIKTPLCLGFSNYSCRYNIMLLLCAVYMQHYVMLCLSAAHLNFLRPSQSTARNVRGNIENISRKVTQFYDEFKSTSTLPELHHPSTGNSRKVKPFYKFHLIMSSVFYTNPGEPHFTVSVYASCCHETLLQNPLTCLKKFYQVIHGS